LSAESGLGGDLLDSDRAGQAAIRGSALRTLGYAAGVLLSLASAPLLIRHLGVADFGRYTTVLSLVALVAGLTEGGLNQIALREMAANDRGQRETIMANVLGLRLILATVTVAVAIAFAIVLGFEAALVLGTLAAATGIFITLLQTLLVISLQGNLRFGWTTLLELLRQTLSVVLIVVLVVVGAGLVPFFFIPIPVGLIVLGVSVPLVRKLIPLRPRFDRALLWPLVRDTLPFAAAVAANVVYFRIAVVLIAVVASKEQTGYFATSFRIVDVIIGIPALIVSAAFPILARASAQNDAARFSYATGRLGELMVVLGVLLALPLALGAPVVIEILGGAEAEPAVPVLRIHAAALVITCVALGAGHALLSVRRHTAILIANLAALLTVTSLTLVLASSEGARGAATATFAAEAVLAAGLLIALARGDSGAPLRSLGNGAARVLLAGAAGAAVALLPGLPPLADAAIGVVVFGATLTALGRFPPELAEAIRGRRPVN